MKLPSTKHTTAVGTRPRTTVQAFSAWGCCILSIGTGLVIAPVGFLAFFWVESRAATEADSRPPSPFWNTIVLRGWAARAVTISSIFIRMAISLQSGLMTAMLASIIIERRGVYLPQMPDLSVRRSVSSGAHNLFLSLLSGPWTLKQLGFGALALLVAATSFASNFTSTLLLADFSVVDIPGAVKTMQVPVGIIASHDTVGTNHWTSQPNRFPRFAELAGEPRVAAGLQDTGPSSRAFLPFSTLTARQSLKHFRGQGPVFNSRVMCVRPLLHNLTIDYIAGVSVFISGRFTGFDVPYDKDTLPAVAQSFNCTLVQHTGGSNTYSIKSLCYTRLQERDGDGPISYRSLVFRTSEAEYWEPWSLQDFKQSPDGAWNTWTSKDKTQTLWATSCNNSADEPQLKFISMTASQTYKEPTIESDPRTGKTETGNIISLYCTHCKTSARKAGRMQLMHPKNTQQDNQTFIPVYAQLAQGITQFQLWRGVPMLPYSANSINQVYSEIFWDVVDQSGNVAFAMQTLQTLLTQAAYYSVLPRFNANSTSERQSWEPRLLPTGVDGLTVVVIIIAIHVLLMFLVSVLFLRMTCHSFLLNVWPAVTQLYSTDHFSEHVMKQSTSMTDKQVHEHLKCRDQHKLTCSVTCSEPQLQQHVLDTSGAARARLHRRREGPLGAMEALLPADIADNNEER